VDSRLIPVPVGSGAWLKLTLRQPFAARYAGERPIVDHCEMIHFSPVGGVQAQPLGPANGVHMAKNRAPPGQADHGSAEVAPRPSFGALATMRHALNRRVAAVSAGGAAARGGARRRVRSRRGGGYRARDLRRAAARCRSTCAPPLRLRPPPLPLLFGLPPGMVWSLTRFLSAIMATYEPLESQPTALHEVPAAPRRRPNLTCVIARDGRRCSNGTILGSIEPGPRETAMAQLSTSMEPPRSRS
jgi:hypothetical protein